MNNNEKAAVAAGLWEPGRKCDGIVEAADVTTTRLAIAPDGRTWTCICGRIFRFPDGDEHDIPAPDMHDPANLWRALENDADGGVTHDMLHAIARALLHRNPEIIVQYFVALYDAEHRAASYAHKTTHQGW